MDSKLNEFLLMLEFNDKVSKVARARNQTIEKACRKAKQELKSLMLENVIIKSTAIDQQKFENMKNHLSTPINTADLPRHDWKLLSEKLQTLQRVSDSDAHIFYEKLDLM